MYYSLNKDNQYGPTFNFNLEQVPDRDSIYIKAEVVADLVCDGELTFTFTGERGKKILQYRGENFWMGHDIEGFMGDQNRARGYFAFRIPEHLKKDDLLRISLWNRNGKPVKVRSFDIYLVDNIWN